jgi:hypothetical protein
LDLILISYTVGTIIGIWFGFKFGVKTGADMSISMLMAEGYLKYKKLKDGEIEFLKADS